MKTPLHPSVLIKTLLPLILLGSFSAYAQKSESAPEETGFVKREVTIWSDGTRMYGDLYEPKNLREGQKLPAVVFVNGTGGPKASCLRGLLQGSWKGDLSFSRSITGVGARARAS